MRIEGKLISEKISNEVKEIVNTIIKNDETEPKLAIIRVDNQASSMVYEKRAVRKCESLGIAVETISFSDSTNTLEVLNEIQQLNGRFDVSGIMCLKPMPKHIDENIINNTIRPEKDVDCANPENMAKLVFGDKTAFMPCTASAVIEILDGSNIDIEGMDIVVIGRSTVIGKPVALELLNRNATVTICHSKTVDLRDKTSKADIVIAAIGLAKFIDESYIKDGAIVIDVGINVDENGSLYGDVNFDTVAEKAIVTPVPGGVGAVTTSVLAKHVVMARQNMNK